MKVSIDNTTIADGYLKIGYVKGDFTRKALHYLHPVNDNSQLTTAAGLGNNTMVFINTAFSTYNVGEIYKYNLGTTSWVLQTIVDGNRFIIATREINNVKFIRAGVERTAALAVGSILEWWQKTTEGHKFISENLWAYTEPTAGSYMELTVPDIIVKFDGTSWATWTFDSGDITHSLFLPLKVLCVVQDPDDTNRIYITKEGYAHYKNHFVTSFLAQDVVDFETTYSGDVDTLLTVLAESINGATP